MDIPGLRRLEFCCGAPASAKREKRETRERRLEICFPLASRDYRTSKSVVLGVCLQRVPEHSLYPIVGMEDVREGCVGKGDGKVVVVDWNRSENSHGRTKQTT